MNLHVLAECLRIFGPITLTRRDLEPSSETDKEVVLRHVTDAYGAASRIFVLSVDDDLLMEMFTDSTTPVPGWLRNAFYAFTERGVPPLKSGLGKWVTAICATQPPEIAAARIDQVLTQYKTSTIYEHWAGYRKVLCPSPLLSAVVPLIDARRLYAAIAHFGLVELPSEFRRLVPSLEQNGEPILIEACMSWNGRDQRQPAFLFHDPDTRGTAVAVYVHDVTIDVKMAMWLCEMVIGAPLVPSNQSLVALATLPPQLSRPFWERWRESLSRSSSGHEKTLSWLDKATGFTSEALDMSKTPPPTIEPQRLYEALRAFGDIEVSGAFYALVPGQAALTRNAAICLMAGRVEHTKSMYGPAVVVQEVGSVVSHTVALSDLVVPPAAAQELFDLASRQVIYYNRSDLVATASLPPEIGARCWHSRAQTADFSPIWTSSMMNKLFSAEPIGAQIMTNSPTVKDRAVKATKGTAAMLGEAAKQVAVQQASAMVAEGMVRIVRQTAGDAWPPFLDTPVGQVIAKISVPVLIHAALEAFDADDTMLLAAQVRELAAAAVQGTAVEASRDLVKLLGPMLSEMALLATAANAGLLTPKSDAVAEETEDADIRARRAYLDSLPGI